MALAGCSCLVRRMGADDTPGCAINRQHRHNHVGVDYGNDDLDAKPNGRRQIYRRIRFIELGFGKVDSGYDRYAD